MKKFLIIFLLILVFLLVIQFIASAQDTSQNKTAIKYQVNLNGTLDKSTVERLIIISNNQLVLHNKWIKFENIFNYRFGFVQPNGKPKTDLENDFLIQLENHFLPDKKFFPSVITGFENSINLRELNARYYAGAGVGAYLCNKPNNFIHFNLYGLYEKATFKVLDYDVVRIMPSIKGRVTFNNKKIGLVYSAFYAQAMNEAQNYRLRAFLKPYFKISKQIELNVMYDLWYEGKVNDISPNEISTLTFGLTISNL